MPATDIRDGLVRANSLNSSGKLLLRSPRRP